MSLFAIIALSVGGYCLLTYIIFWFYLLKGSSPGCGLDALAVAFWLVSPLIPPYLVFKFIYRGISNLRK